MVQSTTGALTTSYRYNGLGQRVSKTAPGSTAVSRRFVYDETGHLLGEYDAAGIPIEETVYLGDLPIAILSGTDTIHYVYTDQINTPREITDTLGTVRWRWDSDPFGVALPDQDPDGDTVAFTYNPRFPGQYFDAETGLHYNTFRDYDPRVGRYVESDPIGLDGGINTYTYVKNNPVSLVDPYGLEAVAAMSQLGWGIDPNEGPQRQCAWLAFRKNFNDMISANTIGADRYFHCKANCEASKCGKYGAEQGCIISDTREFTDTYLKYPFKRLIGSPGAPSYPASKNDSAQDEAANVHGRNRAANSPGTSCAATCSFYRPPGLHPKY